MRLGLLLAIWACWVGLWIVLAQGIYGGHNAPWWFYAADVVSSLVFGVVWVGPQFKAWRRER